MREVDAIILEQAPAEFPISTPVRGIFSVQEVDHRHQLWPCQRDPRAVAATPKAYGIVSGNRNFVLVLLGRGVRRHVGKDPGMELDSVKEPALPRFGLKRTVTIPGKSFAGQQVAAEEEFTAGDSHPFRIAEMLVHADADAVIRARVRLAAEPQLLPVRAGAPAGTSQ